jgi:cytochrome c-type biogenesis protein CcmF
VRDIFDKTRHKGLIKACRPDPQLLGHADGAPGHRGVRPGRGAVEPEQRRARPAHGAGRVVELAGYHFMFEGAKHFEGPNFTPTRAPCGSAAMAGSRVLHPEKRLYTVQQSMMTEAGIDAGFHPRPVCRPRRAAGERRLGGARAYQTVRPLDLAGRSADRPGRLLAALDRRYRVKVKTRVREALGVSGAAA